MSNYSDSEQPTILNQMSADLEAMFRHMGSESRQQEIAKHAAMIQFTKEFSEKQAKLLAEQQERRSVPPTVEKSWQSPQSVKAANQQFQKFSKFSKHKETEIDAGSHDLVELNNLMIEGLNQYFSQSET